MKGGDETLLGFIFLKKFLIFRYKLLNITGDIQMVKPILQFRRIIDIQSLHTLVKIEMSYIANIIMHKAGGIILIYPEGIALQNALP